MAKKKDDNQIPIKTLMELKKLMFILNPNFPLVSNINVLNLIYEMLYVKINDYDTAHEIKELINSVEQSKNDTKPFREQLSRKAFHVLSKYA